MDTQAIRGYRYLLRHMKMSCVRQNLHGYNNKKKISQVILLRVNDTGSQQTESRKRRDGDDEPCEGSTSPSYRIVSKYKLSFIETINKLGEQI